MSQHQHLIALGTASACCCAAAWYCWHNKPELLKKAQRWVSRNAPLWKVQVGGVLPLSNRCVSHRGLHGMNSVACHHRAFHKPPSSTIVCVNIPQHTSLVGSLQDVQAWPEPCHNNSKLCCFSSFPFLDVQAAGSAGETALEPGEGPWPAAGFPGPPQCRPISTITQLLTWQPPQPTTAGVQDTQNCAKI
jgi:hypothetical protein